MKFVITEIRDKDRFVIYDMENGGSACVSKYTIKQLLEDNSSIIIGVTYSFKDKMPSKEIVIEDIIPYTRDGSRPAVKVNKNTFVPDTKRSYVTIVKGIYPSRAEKKAQNDKAKKTRVTKKANNKAKKESELKAEKERKEAEKKEKAKEEYFRINTKRLQKSKPQLYLEKQEIIASEYNDSSTYSYKVEVRTASALTKLNNLIKSSRCYADTRGAGDIIRRGGIFRTELTSDWELETDDQIQVYAANTIYVSFDGSWENRCEIRFEKYNSYRPEFTYTHGTDFDGNTAFGADASCDYSGNGFARYFRKILGRPA